MFIAWLMTVPAAAAVGALCYGLDRLTGPYVVFAFLLVVAGALVAWSRLRPVNHKNVNDAWDAESAAEGVIAESLMEHDPGQLAVPSDDRPEPLVQR
jgi:PiT family inorganic phosphate transporter